MSRAADNELVGRVRQNGQAVLLELLRATAEAGESFVRSGMFVDEEDLPQRLPLAVEKVAGAISSIRYFTPRLDDEAARTEIRHRVVHLENGLDELCRLLKRNSRLIIFPGPPSKMPLPVKAPPQREVGRKAAVHIMQKTAS
jgi:hypothetical protein